MEIEETEILASQSSTNGSIGKGQGKSFEKPLNEQTTSENREPEEHEVWRVQLTTVCLKAFWYYFFLVYQWADFLV